MQRDRDIIAERHRETQKEGRRERDGVRRGEEREREKERAETISCAFVPGDRLVLRTSQCVRACVRARA